MIGPTDGRPFAAESVASAYDIAVVGYRDPRPD
jgi:hypothetical protein